VLVNKHCRNLERCYARFFAGLGIAENVADLKVENLARETSKRWRERERERERERDGERWRGFPVRFFSENGCLYRRNDVSSRGGDRGQAERKRRR
jgi:hypothetical protein